MVGNNVHYTPIPWISKELVNVFNAMDLVLLMIRPKFLSAANRLELECCLRRHCEEHGIACRANAIFF